MPQSSSVTAGKGQEMNPTKSASTSAESPRSTITITDNRNGRQYEIPVKNDTIRAIDLRKIKVEDRFRDDELRSRLHQYGVLHQQGYFHRRRQRYSSLSGLFHRGIGGKKHLSGDGLPDSLWRAPQQAQLADWNYHVTHHTFIHESIKKFLDGFHYDAHPMGMLISTVAALSTFYPDAKDIFNADSRRKQTYRLIGKMPTLAAFAYRHSMGMPFVYPDNDLSYAGNFLNMFFRTTELKYHPNPTLERTLDVLFILHADHEPNCSSTAMRGVGSSTPTRIARRPRPPPPFMARSTVAPTSRSCACLSKSARSTTFPLTSRK